MQNTPNKQLKITADLLSDIGVLLISNGANSTRTSRNLTRISDLYGYKNNLFFSHSAIIITLEDPKTQEQITLVKAIKGYQVNFSIISEISILSWDIVKRKIELKEIRNRLDDISKTDSYPEWLKILFIGVATASLAKIFGTTSFGFFVAFCAAVVGIFTRNKLLLKKYNLYIVWLISSFVSTSVVNICREFGFSDANAALTACVLWLIPGVVLINGFLDILEGHIVSGWAKSAMGFLLVFMIAVGFYLSLFLFGYDVGV